MNAIGCFDNIFRDIYERFVSSIVGSECTGRIANVVTSSEKRSGESSVHGLSSGMRQVEIGLNAQNVYSLAAS